MSGSAVALSSAIFCLGALTMAATVGWTAGARAGGHWWGSCIMLSTILPDPAAGCTRRSTTPSSSAWPRRGAWPPTKLLEHPLWKRHCPRSESRGRQHPQDHEVGLGASPLVRSGRLAGSCRAYPEALCERLPEISLRQWLLEVSPSSSRCWTHD